MLISGATAKTWGMSKTCPLLTSWRIAFDSTGQCTFSDRSSFQLVLDLVVFDSGLGASHFRLVADPLQLAYKRCCAGLVEVYDAAQCCQGEQIMATVPILASFDANQKVIIKCDALPHGAGACFLHRYLDRSWWPACSVSQALSSARSHYSQLEHKGTV